VRGFPKDQGFDSIGCNGGKSPGTQVQHALAIGTRGTEFRHFLPSNCGTIWANAKSARGFAPIAIGSRQLSVKSASGGSPRWRWISQRSTAVSMTSAKCSQTGEAHRLIPSPTTRQRSGKLSRSEMLFIVWCCFTSRRSRTSRFYLYGIGQQLEAVMDLGVSNPHILWKLLANLTRLMCLTTSGR
jgi:hypothetical protein